MKRFGSLVMLALVTTVAACSADVVSPTVDPLAGLQSGEELDISDGFTSPSDPGAMAFHGYVLGAPLSTNYPGGDSLTTWPRVAGVEITVYAFTGFDSNLRPVAGAKLGSVTSDANGYFRYTSQLADDEYVISFVPPAGSPYRGSFWVYTIKAEWSQRLLGAVLGRNDP